jgi:hypothetical protein
MHFLLIILVASVELTEISYRLKVNKGGVCCNANCLAVPRRYVKLQSTFAGGLNVTKQNKMLRDVPEHG